MGRIFIIRVERLQLSKSLNFRFYSGHYRSLEQFWNFDESVAGSTEGITVNSDILKVFHASFSTLILVPLHMVSNRAKYVQRRV
jgi:hypothetical protein